LDSDATHVIIEFSWGLSNGVAEVVISMFAHPAVLVTNLKLKRWIHIPINFPKNSVSILCSFVISVTIGSKKIHYAGVAERVIMIFVGVVSPNPSPRTEK